MLTSGERRVIRFPEISCAVAVSAIGPSAISHVRGSAQNFWEGSKIGLGSAANEGGLQPLLSRSGLKMMRVLDAPHD